MKKEMHKFLGLCNYVRQWVFDYSTLIAPLLAALKDAKSGGTQLTWTPKMQETFTKLKEEITKARVLGTPDYNK